MKTDISKFSIKLLLFLGILFLADFTTGKLLNFFYNRQSRGLEFKTNYCVNTMKEDMLVLGSSRAVYHYSPRILEDSLHLSVYNAGRDGNFIFYSYGIFKAALERYTPKLILLEIGPKEFIESQDSYDRLSVLMPFYKSHSELKQVLDLKSPNEKIRNISNCYPYNSMINSIISGNVSRGKTEDIYQGHSSFTTNISRDAKTVLNSLDYKIDSNKVKLFTDIILTCKLRGIGLIVACSPLFDTLKGTDLSMQMARQITIQHGVELIDNSGNLNYTGHKELFYDFNHLNRIGAEKYTREISRSLQSVHSRN